MFIINTHQLEEVLSEFPVQSLDGCHCVSVDAVFDHVTMDGWTDGICDQYEVC